MQFLKHICSWFVTFVLMILAVCGDLQPQDSMFVTLGNIGVFVFWVYMIAVILAVSLMAATVVQGKHVPAPPKIYRVLNIIRWISASLWLAAFGHWVMAGIWLVTYTVAWALETPEEKK